MISPARHPLRTIGAAAALGAVLLAGLPSAHATRSKDAITTITLDEYYGTFGTFPQGLGKLYADYKKASGVTVKHTAYDFTSYTQKVLQLAQTQSLPDVLVFDPSEMPLLASTGAVQPIDDFVKGWGQRGSYFPGSIAESTYQGKLYGLPVGLNDLALQYNTAMFAAAGIKSPPGTFAELAKDAALLTKGTVHGIGIDLSQDGTNYTDATWYQPFLYGAGGSLLHPNGAGGVQALTFIKSLITSGSMAKDVISWGGGTASTNFDGKKVAMIIDGPWELAGHDAKKIPYATAPLPVAGPVNKPTSWLGGEMWLITATDPARRQAAWNFLKFSQIPGELSTFDGTIGYLPARRDALQPVLAGNAKLQPFAAELPYAYARAAGLGKNYSLALADLSKAVQGYLAGSDTAQGALNAAASKIAALH